MLVQTVKPLYADVRYGKEELRCRDEQQPRILVHKRGRGQTAPLGEAPPRASVLQQRRRLIRARQGLLGSLKVRRGQLRGSFSGIGMVHEW